MKVQTVNVIKIVGDLEYTVHSFTDDDSGEKEAEELFRTLILEEDDKLTDEQLDHYMGIGFCDLDNFVVVLTYSEY